ncbi:OprD family porin [Pseudomonas putida]|uniref:OprD family porin n=1 Tax=Pseudomonas putida TaxID=303 RepID=UPI00383A24B4
MLLVAQGVSAAFLADSKTRLDFRNFYFINDNRSTGATPSKTQGWAQGFVFRHESGFTDGPVGLGLDVTGMLALTLDSGGGRHLGSSMIPSASDGTAVGQWGRLGGTAKFRVSRTELRQGTLAPRLPILQANDGRVLPQTFEGTLITSRELPGLTLNAGHLDKAVGRGSSDRTGLAAAGGTRQSDDFWFAGGDWQATRQLTAQYYFAHLQDYYDQQFIGLLHTWPIAQGRQLRTDLRYFRTQASGNNRSGSAGYRVNGYTDDNDGKIDNLTWSAAATYTHDAHSVTAGYQSVSGASDFTQLNQGRLPGKGAAGTSLYLYTDRLVQSFNRAGERTAFAQYAYDFTALGAPGLTASLAYLDGRGIKSRSGASLTEWERDLGLDYVVQSGALKGLGFGWRNGTSNSQVDGDQDQTRVYINYSLPLR